MARLLAVGLLLWTVYATIDFAVANAPTAAAASIGREGGPSPLEVISETVTQGPTQANLIPRGPALAFGVYEVTESPDPKEAARDRDYRPRIKLFVDQEDIDDEGVDNQEEEEDEEEEEDDRNERTTTSSRAGRDDRSDDDDLPDDDPRDDDLSDDDEIHVVQGEITPGLYATSFETEDCSYELWRVLQTRRPEIIAEDYLASGRMLVTINGIEPDWFTSTEPCGEWYAWTPLTEPLTEADNGDYWVGDLARGVWEVPPTCRWEKVTGFRGAFIHDVIDSAKGPGSMTVAVDTYGVRIRGCRSPIKLKAPARNSVATP